MESFLTFSSEPWGRMGQRTASDEDGSNTETERRTKRDRGVTVSDRKETMETRYPDLEAKRRLELGPKLGDII